MFGFSITKIVDPYNTMGADRQKTGAAPQKTGKSQPRHMPAAVGDGDMDGIPLKDIARAHGLTLEAAEWFRDAWNEADRYSGTARGRRAELALGDIEADSQNFKRWY